MPCIVCPDCLTLHGIMSVCVQGEACRKCGKVPDVVLTPGEIRACIKNREPFTGRDAT